MFKKIIALLLALIICVAFTACNGGTTGGTTGGTDTPGGTYEKPEPADHEHEYTSRIGIVPATCEKEGVKAHYECKICKKTFVFSGGKYSEVSAESLAIPKTNHKFVYEVQDEKYLVSEATEDTPRTYKKSCVCGLAESGKNVSTFTVGKALREYENVDKSLYMPTSLTVTLYETANCKYGFTWNTSDFPAMPVVKYCEGDSLTGATKEAYARTEEAASFKYSEKGDERIKFYVSKVEIELKPSTSYTYKVEDKYLNVATETVTIKTVNPSVGKFKFSHVSDSQSGTVPNGTGEYFNGVLGAIEKNGSDFIVHTGDVVDRARYEGFWKEMLDTNFRYLSKMPVMAISGNHETTYQSGCSNETYKHFNYKIPQQDTEKGFYYSFSYGNVKFIMLNTNRLTVNCLTDDQYEWLEKELSEKTEKWTIVALHNPLYSVGKWGANASINATALALQEQLGDLFAKNKVDLVLQGHDHCISRTFPIGEGGKVLTEKITEIDGIPYTENPEGVLYVMNGPAGDQARKVFAVDENLYSYGEDSFKRSWADLEIDGNKLTVTVKRYEGGVKIYKQWGIIKAA